MKLIRTIRTILGLDRPAGKPGAFLHELFVFLAFCAFTSVLTWPYINHLRNAIADTGDPYLVSWILWWDYHQTFTDPLNLFHANVFYPLRYTLAFSEHCYGIALPFFPLFALGLQPVTVHATAMFFGFALCGYGAFRLARTLTGSHGVAWVAGIVFAFVPFRFHLLSHLPYLFSPWLPLLFEALVLFVRERSKKRAVWLGVAIFLSGLTSISWLTLSTVPFAFAAAILLTRYGIWREKTFWLRAAAACSVALVALLPFTLPYYFASKMYGFKRSIDEVKANSAWPMHWFSVENRNKLWNGMGVSVPEGYRFKLFPGLLPILLSLVAVLLIEPLKIEANVKTRGDDQPPAFMKWLAVLDVIIPVALVLSIIAIGFDRSDFFYGFFKLVTSERALALLTVATIARLSIAYPARLRRGVNASLVQTLRSERRSDAFWIGSMLTIVGFCYSLGWNFFFYRVCYDLIPMFRSMRVPTRGAMFAYLGLALLAGLGVQRLAELTIERRSRFRPAAVFAIACALLLVEFNAAPLKFQGGDVYPDAVTLRLKQTDMRGGLVVLPAGANYNHRHILRAADHQKPLIVGTSGFNSSFSDQIDTATSTGAIKDQFLDLLESIPTSYVLVQNHLIVPERRTDYEVFLSRAVLAGRLRFVNRFEGRDDLYAVVKIEPEAKAEAPMPFSVEVKDWQQLITDDPVNILGHNRQSSELVYRVHVASFGEMPRYSEFLADLKLIGQGAVVNSDSEQSQIEFNLNEFAVDWVGREKFQSVYGPMTHDRYIDKLSENAGITLNLADRVALIDKLDNGAATRAQALLEIARNPDLVKKEERRSLVLLHYFGYLRRNPGDSPDQNLDGLKFWLSELEKSGEPERLPLAFMSSIEYQERNRKP